jgi:hypothetical protein
VVNFLFDVIKQITLFFLFLAATFAGLAGFLLNWTVYITVFQFGNIIGNNAGMLAAWGVLRDIGNIILLFGFIFMGISTILNLPGNEFTARRALPALIIFAVLMNFSLFAAEAVIDTSNALGTTFYKQASGGMCAPNQGFIDCATNSGIGGKVLQVTGISKIFDTDAQKQITSDEPAGAITALGLTIFAAVTAFVFFAAVFMFIARAVVLAFLMAVSPIGFAGMAIPPLHRFASMWWEQLLKQSFFAPIYILLVLISLKFMEGITVALSSGGSGSVQSLAAAFDRSGQSNVSMIINFILITGFMLGAIQIAKSLGAAGAGGATKFAGAATFGTVGFVGRRTIGRGSGALATRIRSSSLGETGFGRALVGVADRGAAASFDARTNKLVAGGFKNVNIDAGKPSKEAAHGYHGIEEKAIKARVDYAKSLRGERTESKSEMQVRLDKQKATATTALEKATAEVTATETALEAAAAAQATQKTHRDNVAHSLAEQQARVAQNPADAAAQVALSQLTQQLARENQELAQADQKLAGANNAQAKAADTLAKAQAGHAKAEEDQTTKIRGTISQKQRRENYATEIEHRSVIPFAPAWTQKIDPTVESHANHAAAMAIKSYEGKSGTERLLSDLGDELKKGTEKGDEHAAQEHEDASHKPAGGSGGSGGSHGGGH